MRIFSRILVVLGGTVCLLSAGGCSKRPLPPTGNPVAGPARGDLVSTFSLVGHTETGRKKWEVQGETADLMSEVVDLSPVRATSFGQVELKLAAERGRFHKATHDVHLEGDVVATTSDGAVLTTQSLDWEQERQMGRTPDWVRVTRPGMTAVGLGGVGFPKLKKVRLERQVTVTLQDPKGKTVITCDGPMEVDYRRRHARFLRNVRVEDAQGVILADRLDIALEAASNRMEEATFWGHVQIHHGEEVARANRVNYWQPLGRIRLVGHPKLVLFTPEERLAESGP